VGKRKKVGKAQTLTKRCTGNQQPAKAARQPQNGEPCVNHMRETVPQRSANGNPRMYKIQPVAQGRWQV